MTLHQLLYRTIELLTCIHFQIFSPHKTSPFVLVCFCRMYRPFSAIRLYYKNKAPSCFWLFAVTDVSKRMIEHLASSFRKDYCR